IEVGLGGRLDSTNVITPEVSVITNIGFDHMDMLGDTLPKIAFEKAGIIKQRIPVVISERQEEVAQVFEDKAKLEQAPILFTDKPVTISQHGNSIKVNAVFQDQRIEFDFPLLGSYQQKNIAGVLTALECLTDRGFSISKEQVCDGMQQVISQTGLKG